MTESTPTNTHRHPRENGDPVIYGTQKQELTALITGSPVKAGDDGGEVMVKREHV